MHKILVVRLYFLLGALHVSDSSSPSSGATGCCVAIATQKPDVSAYTGVYQMRCTAYKVAPEGGLI